MATSIEKSLYCSWLARCREIIFGRDSIQTIASGLCSTAVDEGPFSFAWYGELFADKKTVRAISVSAHDIFYPDADGFNHSVPPKSPPASAWIQRQPVIVSDIESEAGFDEWRTAALDNGFHSMIALPVNPFSHCKGIWVLYAGKDFHITDEFACILQEISEYLGQMLDILDERAVHKNEYLMLSRREEMYRSVFENTGTGTIIIDFDMTIMYANAMFLDLTGYLREETENRMKWSQFVAPQDIDRMQQFHYGRRRHDSGVPTEYECRVIDRDGTLKYMYMKVGMIPDSLYSIASFMDITTRKLAEDQLRQSESRLSAIIEAFDGFIYISDADFKIQFMNKALKERSGGNGINLCCYNVLHGRDKPCETCSQSIVLAGETVRKEIKSELDGRWYAMTRTPVKQIDGKVERIQTILIDITERKIAEEALVKSADVLRDENRRLRSSIKDRYKFGNIIGKSPSMQSVYELILKAAMTNAHVIVQGESGTGKELVARAIHDMSDRKDKRFVPVNCGAISETIIESEFFGYKKGAFTGANTDKPGYLDIADGGTLFLDEIGEIGLSMQVKLLRAIEGGGYTPVGDNVVKLPNLRIVAATNRNLKELVVQGEMRQDFFYRIHVIPVYLPALRERREDLPLLIDHFMARFGGDQPPPPISGTLLDAFMSYPWPGNIRELENVIRRYVTIGNLEFFQSLAIETSPRKQQVGAIPEIPRGVCLEDAMSIAEKEIIRQALVDSKWQKGRAAELLGIHRKTLFTKIKKLGLE